MLTVTPRVAPFTEMWDMQEEVSRYSDGDCAYISVLVIIRVAMSCTSWSCLGIHNVFS